MRLICSHIHHMVPKLNWPS